MKIFATDYHLQNRMVILIRIELLKTQSAKEDITRQKQTQRKHTPGNKQWVDWMLPSSTKTCVQRHTQHRHTSVSQSCRTAGCLSTGADIPQAEVLLLFLYLCLALFLSVSLSLSVSLAVLSVCLSLPLPPSAWVSSKLSWLFCPLPTAMTASDSPCLWRERERERESGRQGERAGERLSW